MASRLTFQEKQETLVLQRFIYLFKIIDTELHYILHQIQTFCSDWFLCVYFFIQSIVQTKHEMCDRLRCAIKSIERSF